MSDATPDSDFRCKHGNIVLESDDCPLCAREVAGNHALAPTSGARREVITGPKALAERLREVLREIRDRAQESAAAYEWGSPGASKVADRKVAALIVEGDEAASALDRLAAENIALNAGAADLVLALAVCNKERRTLAARPALDEETTRPRITCLCGSTRFIDTFFEQGWRLTLEGVIVLSVGVVKTTAADESGGHAAEQLGPDVAQRLDELHLRKIDLADDVLVLNVDGYVGESARREIAYAEAHGKPVHYLEPLARLAGGKDG